jgi:hypothetical protein
MDWQFLLWMLLRFIIPFAIAVFFMWVGVPNYPGTQPNRRAAKRNPRPAAPSLTSLPLNNDDAVARSAQLSKICRFRLKKDNNEKTLATAADGHASAAHTRTASTSRPRSRSAALTSNCGSLSSKQKVTCPCPFITWSWITGFLRWRIA